MKSSESANVGVVGMIDGVVGKFADSGGVPAMDCWSKHSESGGVCFSPVSSCMAGIDVPEMSRKC